MASHTRVGGDSRLGVVGCVYVVSEVGGGRRYIRRARTAKGCIFPESGTADRATEPTWVLPSGQDGGIAKRQGESSIDV